MPEAVLSALDAKGRSVEKTTSQRFAIRQGRFQGGCRRAPSAVDRQPRHGSPELLRSNVGDLRAAEILGVEFDQVGESRQSRIGDPGAAEVENAKIR